MLTDPVTEQRLAFLFPPVAEAWRAVDANMFSLHGWRLRLVDGLRSREAERVNWAKGRTKSADGHWTITDIHKVVTHAFPGESTHGFGLACDSAFLSVDNHLLISTDPYLEQQSPAGRSYLWSELARLYELHGFEAGARWAPPNTDPDHGEMTFGIDLYQLKRLYAIGGNALVWKKCAEQIEVKNKKGVLV